MDTAEAVALSFDIVDRIKPLMAGRPGEVQGAVIAQLLAMWVAGHYLNGEAIMEEVLEHHIAHVRTLIPIEVDALRQMRS